MNCTEARELLPLSPYGDLNPDMRAALDEHLKGCPACREEQSALEEVRRLLDSAPTPKVEINLPALYAEGNRRQLKQVRRWRRAAIVLVGAAAVFLIAFLSKLEIRTEGHQLVLRWGIPPVAGPISNRPAATDQRPAAMPQYEGTTADMRLVKDLLHALAADAQKRDEQWERSMALVQTQINRLDSQANAHWDETKRYVSALHTNQMQTLAKGERQ